MYTKICKKCGEEKPLTSENFNKNRRSKDGFRPRCSTCTKQYDKSYNERRRESRRLYQIEYRKKNKEKVGDYQRRYNKTLSSGIYLIKNKENEKIYVGASTRLKIRLRNHKNHLRKRKHCNKLLQEDYNKYGLNAFEFEVLEEHPPDVDIRVLEKIESEKIKHFFAEGKVFYNTPKSRDKEINELLG